MINIEYIYYKIYLFFESAYYFIFGHSEDFAAVLSRLKVFSFILSLLFGAGVAYNIYVLVRSKQKQIGDFAKMVMEEQPEEKRMRWDKIKRYLASDNSSDWRRAILEADSILDDIIKKIGYRGDTFGDRLSQIKPSQFKNINEAWEAHKVRNRIAHEGETFKLTKDEAERVIGLFEKALKELEYL
jgi:hypothetical protein